MDFHGRGDRAARIYAEFSSAILDGRLRTGEALPPSRELARQLAVSRTTVSVAYDRLLAEGLTQARGGAGTFVAEQDRTVSGRRAQSGAVRPRAFWRMAPAPIGADFSSLPYRFSMGVPDARLFPTDVWRRLLASAWRNEAATSGNYGNSAGLPALQAAIARHVGRSRSVRAAADDVIVTSGAQQAFDLIARVMVEPGDLVAVEEPGYPPVRSLFESLGARVVGVPVDDEGIVVDAISAHVRLVYTTPSHQFPTGVRTLLARRSALLAWAEVNNGLVIEDDYDSEFRFDDRPLAPLQSMDRTGRVVYVGTFSKTLLPGIRIGFLVAPASLQLALATARRLGDWHGETATQYALARLIEDGHFARHLRRAQREYARRRRLIIEIIERDFAGWLRLVPSVAGLHVCAELLAGVPVSAARVVESARVMGVGVQSLESFSTEPGRAGIVIGFGAVQLDEIEDGMRLLGDAFRRALAS